MQLSKVAIIFKKEMTDTLRDRRTLIFMLLIPVVAVPLLMMGMSKLMVSQITKVKEEMSVVVIEGLAFLPGELQDQFTQASGLTLRTEDDYEAVDLTEELRQGNIDVLVIASADFDSNLAQEKPAEIEVLYDGAEIKSEFAKDRVEKILIEFKDQTVHYRLAQRDISIAVLTPFSVDYKNVAPMQKMIGKELGLILPYLIIIMCFMGAMYPAIDLAAGEKERGTLETLLVSPASRGEFVVGKYLVVLTTGIVAAFLSMGSLTFSMKYMVEDLLKGAGQMLAIEFDPQTVLLVLLTILPLAGIFAGILLSVSIFARSFKEAQSYVTALNFAIILPAFASFLPGVELGYETALIPVVNVSLIIKDAVSGTVEWHFVLLALVSNTVLAGLSLLFSRKWFEKESVLFRM
ncbi:MAG: ABC transporter permease [bacterium]